MARRNHSDVFVLETENPRNAATMREFTYNKEFDADMKRPIYSSNSKITRTFESHPIGYRGKLKLCEVLNCDTVVREVIPTRCHPRGLPYVFEPLRKLGPGKYCSRYPPITYQTTVHGTFCSLSKISHFILNSLNVYDSGLNGINV